MQGRTLPDTLHTLQVFPSKWREEMQLNSQLGFDFIEILADKNQAENNPLFNTRFLPELTEISQAQSLPTPTVCADFFTEYSFEGASEQHASAIFHQLIERMVLLHSTGLVLPFFNKSELSDASQLEAILRKLAPSLKIAAKNSIRILVECTLPSSEVCAVLDMLGADSPVSLCFDLGNTVALGRDPVEEIKTAGNWIGHVHIKDCRFNIPGNVPLGQGDVDFPSCFEALRRVEYQGLVALETSMGDAPQLFAENHLRMVTDWLNQ